MPIVLWLCPLPVVWGIAVLWRLGAPVSQEDQSQGIA
jgi:hypothetical protein